MLYIISALVLIILILIVWGLVSSRNIKINEYKIAYANLPQVFDGYKIVQLSDYHKGTYKNDNDELIEKVEQLNPDIILLTGDIIDEKSKDIDGISALCKNLVKISEVIWVKGNHFYKADEKIATSLEDTLIDMGVIILENDYHIIEIKGELLNFCGLDDPRKVYEVDNLPSEYTKAVTLKVIQRNLDEIEEKYDGVNGFKILVTHRYTNYEIFPDYDYSLVFAGHSHGGQLKFPGGIDLFGSNLELFPKIHSGYNNIDGMPLIISSGLGTSNINLRMYNPPEIVCVELLTK